MRRGKACLLYASWKPKIHSKCNQCEFAFSRATFLAIYIEQGLLGTCVHQRAPTKIKLSAEVRQSVHSSCLLPPSSKASNLPPKMHPVWICIFYGNYSCNAHRMILFHNEFKLDSSLLCSKAIAIAIASIVWLTPLPLHQIWDHCQIKCRGGASPKASPSSARKPFACLLTFLCLCLIKAVERSLESTL